MTRFPFVLSLSVVACFAAEPAGIQLAGPEITRLTWDTRSPSIADFDGDGRLDVAVVNNENAKIFLLYQRAPGEAAAKNARRAVSRNRWEPVVEDSRFEKVSIPADQRHHALVAADFDGDKRPDIALTGVEDALLVRFQAADGTFTKSWKYRDFEALQGAQHLQTADLNGDGRADLAVLGKGKLLVFLQKETGGFSTPTEYLTGEDKAGQLFVEDADRDGKTDLLYLAPGGEGTLRWRRQIAPGVFSAEVALPYSLPAYAATTSRDTNGRLVFTKVNAKSQIIERHAFATGAGGEASDTLLPTVYNVPAGVKIAAYALADFNGDGLADYAIADGKAAQVAVYMQQADGTFAEPRTFPSFAGISGIAPVAIPGSKKSALTVVSRKEGLGISKLTDDGRLEFPTPIAINGEPVSIVQAGAKAVVLVDMKGVWRLESVSTEDGTKCTLSSRNLVGLKREPAGMAAGDLNGDSRPDILLMVPREPALILPGVEGGIGEPLKETANIRSQLSDLSPERVTLVDIDGDKRDEIVSASSGFARSIRMTQDNLDVAVLDQFNARQSDNKLATPAFMDVDGDGKPELVFNEAGTQFFQVMKKDAAGVYRVVRRLAGSPGEAVQVFPISPGGAKAPQMLVSARDRFWTAPFTAGAARLELVDSYDTDLQNCSYYFAFSADLDKDGKSEVVVFDRSSQIMELLVPAAGPGVPWKSMMHFVLFEMNIHFRGRKGETSVREVLVKDLTGDGRPDILMLVHDRMLLFPQG
jgi:hypothetical protein